MWTDGHGKTSIPPQLSCRGYNKQVSKGNIIGYIPGTMDTPVLFHLFSKTEKQKKNQPKTEKIIHLIIFMKPKHLFSKFPAAMCEY